MPPKSKTVRDLSEVDDIELDVPQTPKVTQVVEVVEEDEEISSDNFATTKDEEKTTKSSQSHHTDEETEVDLDDVVPQKSIRTQMTEKTVEMVDEESDGEESEENRPRNKDRDEEKKEEVIHELFDKDASVGYPEITEHKSNFTRTILMWSILVFLGAILLGALLMFFLRGSGTVTSGTTQQTSETSVTPEPTLAATPAATLKKSDITVDVLNGGGVKGAGAKMKSALEEAGYTVGTVGNADTYEYDETEIVVKKESEAYLELLKADLNKNYTVGKATTGSFAGSADAQVIVGKN